MAQVKTKNRPVKSVKNKAAQPAVHTVQTQPYFSSLGLAHISLLLLALMWVLPFLYYLHAYPRTTFYQEWGAAFLGLCAMPLLVTRRFWLQPQIPRIVLLPIGLLLLVALQFALGQIVYFDQAILVALYLLWAALLMMLGYRLREELGWPLLATVLATGLLIGAELNAMLGILQHYRWHTFLDSVVTVKTSAAVYGNVAQPNHYANYITMGLISLGLLRQQRPLRHWQVALLATPLLFVLVLSGSRSAGLYLLWMAGMAYWWQRREKSCLPLLHYSLLLILGFGLMHFVVQLPMLAGADGTITTAQRFFGNGPSGGIRVYLWREGWLIFSQFPLLGAGLGQYGWQHFLLTEQLRDLNIAGLYNNAHNLVVHLAAEMGAAGVLVLLGTVGLWLYQAARLGERNVYHWWGYAILAVLGIHSMLEYPLWYAYFLSIAALMLGMLDHTCYRLELRNLGRLSVIVILLLGMLSMVQMWQGYRMLEALLAMRPVSAADAQNYNRRMREGIMAIHQQGMMVSMAELYMTNMIEITADNLADKRKLNERVMRFVPISPVVYREAMLMALAGEQEEAKLQMTRAIWSYPADFERTRRQLGELALKDPAHFAALLEFASQKYEEWQRAVHTR